jgi:hypothetical protein
MRWCGIDHIGDCLGKYTKVGGGGLCAHPIGSTSGNAIRLCSVVSDGITTAKAKAADGFKGTL